MIAVIDYGLGNVGSVLNAFEKLGIETVKISKPGDLQKPDALIFPGDGAAGQAMENLEKLNMIIPIKKFIASGKPFLGICLGMQILLTISEEGNVPCLDIIKGKVMKFQSEVKVPQIGWNRIQIKKEKLKMKNDKDKCKKLFKNIPNESYFYFINSFYCEPADKSIVAAETDYGGDFCSVFIKDNITGVQFHPEKSSDIGMQFIRNWRNL